MVLEQPLAVTCDFPELRHETSDGHGGSWQFNWSTGTRRTARVFARVTEPLRVGCGEVWHLDVLTRALAERYHDFAWSVSTDATTLAYSDDLARRRSPLVADRTRAELGIGPSTPADACRRYLDWVESNIDAVAPSGLRPRYTREKQHV